MKLMTIFFSTFSGFCFGNKFPKSNPSMWKKGLIDVLKVSTSIGGSLAISTANYASTKFTNLQSSTTSSEPERYTIIGNSMPTCRLLNGMWQVSGAHGFEPNKEKAVSEMARYAGIRHCK
jgi:hypothetical protein